MNPEDYAHLKQVMQRYPEPALPGVDLTWHMDRAIEALGNANPNVRRSAAEILSNIGAQESLGGKTADVVSALVGSLLTDGSSEVRRSAADA